MSIDKEKKSNRLLASRRYTHDSFTDAQESFTNVLDLQASEVYTQAHKIPSTNLPFSGSSQQGQIYTDGTDNILKYYYRHKLTKSNLNNEVWFFLNPTGSASGIGAQLIDSNQQTSFISPKYSDSTLANATAEDNTPGYLAKVFISSAANSASVSDSDVISVNDYTFDYKTGVLQFTDGTVDPSNSQYVYMSVNQYVGKTLADGIEITGDISGSASSTGSFGHLVVQGNITASGVVRADAFESATGGETIDFGDSINVSGNVIATNLTSDSASFSTRITNLKIDSGSISDRLSDVEAGSTSKTLISSSAQISDEISGSFVAPSSSFSTRITNLVADSASFSTRITITEGELENTIISASEQLQEQISGSFTAPSSSFSTRITNLVADSASFSTRVTDLKTDSGSISTRLSNVEAGSTSKTLISSSAQIADEISGSFTITSASISERLSSVEAGSTSKTLISSSAQIAEEISGSFTTVSSSISIRLSSVEAGSTSKTLISSSAQIAEEISGSFTSTSESISSRLSSVEAGSTSKTLISSSAQIADEISGSFTITSASLSNRITNLVSDSASFSTRITITENELENTIISASEQLSDQISGSFVAPSSSFSSRITTLEGSGEIQSLGTTDNVLFNTITSSNDVKFERNLVVAGTITAQEIHTEIESASIIFTSGSTKFGDTSDDQHEFTGSIFVKGNLTAENLTTDSASFSSRITTAEIELENTIISASEQISDRISGSFVAPSASFSARTTTLEGTGTIQGVGTSDNVTFSNITASSNIKASKGYFTDSAGIYADKIRRYSDSGTTTKIVLNDEVLTLHAGHASDEVIKVQSGKVTIDGDVSASLDSTGSFGHVKIPDDGRLSIGNSNDLQLYHNGNHSFIKDGGSGNLILLTSTFQVKNATNNETMIQANQDGAVTLFHDNTQRLVTQKGGVNITGDITGSGNLKIAGNISSSGNIFGTNLLADSASFSTRVTDLKTDSGSFSLRNTNLETTSSALINNFNQVQSLGKTDSVVFSNITASNNTRLAGNVLMQSELNILGNITASGNISSSGNLFISGDADINGVSNFQGNVTLQNDLIVNTFNNLKVSSGRTLTHQLSMDVSDAWELDDDGNYMPATEQAFVIDPRFKVDAQGNIHLRKQGNELWTDDVHTYFE